MTLLIDIGACCEHHTNDTLEHLHKAIGEGDPELVWDAHPSPLIRALVELFTARGLARLDAVRAGILKWQSGASFRPGQVPPPAPGMLLRWTVDGQERQQTVNGAFGMPGPAAWTFPAGMPAAGTQVSAEVLDPGTGKARGEVWGVYAIRQPAAGH